MRINFSGKLYNVVPYHVSEHNHLVDMAEVEPWPSSTGPR